MGDEVGRRVKNGRELLDFVNRLGLSDRDDVKVERVGKERLAGDLLDLRRHGCREEEGLAILGEPRNNVLEVATETHVEDGVSLVEDELMKEESADGEERAAREQGSHAQSQDSSWR